MDSLRSVARLLTEAYQPLHDVVHGRTDIPENHSLDTFFSAVKATADVSTASLVLVNYTTRKDGGCNIGPKAYKEMLTLPCQLHERGARFILHLLCMEHHA